MTSSPSPRAGLAVGALVLTLACAGCASEPGDPSGADDVYSDIGVADAGVGDGSVGDGATGDAVPAEDAVAGEDVEVAGEDVADTGRGAEVSDAGGEVADGEVADEEVADETEVVPDSIEDTAAVDADAVIDGWTAQDVAAEITEDVSEEIAEDIPEEIAEEVAEDIAAVEDAEVEDAEVEDVEPDVGPETVDDGWTPPVLCAPALDAAPAYSWALPYQLRTITASGGTGAYRFALQDPASASLLNELTGALLAGGEPGVVESIVVTDLGCEGEASAQVEIVEPMTVAPATAVVAPGMSVTLAVAGGSGAWTCALEVSISDGTLEPGGLYNAGATAGSDVISCTDGGTGQTVEVVFTVDPDYALKATPARLSLPVGSTLAPMVAGGSGHHVVEAPGGIIGWDGAAMEGLLPGRVEATLTDTFTGESVPLVVEVIGALEADPVRAGDATNWAVIAAPGDIDGDGYPDVVVSRFEADVAAVTSGAVYIYQGGEEGLDPAPVRVLSGTDRRDEFGRGLATGDFDGDGLVDLAVGADAYNAGLTDNGAVFVYPGVSGQFFSAGPSQILAGQYGYDRLGWRVTACDFNGDGLDDIAASAWTGENRDLEDVPTDQGVLYVYLGTPSGFPLVPDQMVFGRSLVDGEWVDHPDLRLARDLASADFNGDGLCDVIAGVRRLKAGPGRSDDGGGYVFLGRAPNEDNAGGLEDLPALAVLGDGPDAASHLGRWVAAGDLDGDGKAEMVLSQYLYDDPDINGSNQGAIRVFRGAELSGPATAWTSVDDADFVATGNGSNDYYGWTAAVGDVTGDGLADLLVGAANEEIPGGTNSTGTVDVFAGVDGAMPSETPWRTTAGTAGGDWYGTGVGAIGDVDGDGAPDWLVIAGRADDYGIDVGMPLVVKGDAELPAQALTWPDQAAGSQIGRGVAFVGDLDGDGWPELASGAPLLDIEGANINMGRVFLHKGGPTGVPATPSQALSEHTGHSGSDQFGWAVAPGGDFDGDGRSDMLVLARYDDRPGSFGAAYSNPGGCSGSQSNTGAVFVYRGRDGELPANEPSFVWYGSQVSQSMRTLWGGFDLNGDGYDDFIAGGLDWDRPGSNNAGGFSVVFGRPDADPDLIDVICEADATWLGLLPSDYSGGFNNAIRSLGDLDGDGCDEIAVGSYLEDFANSNQGTTRVFFGFGGPGCPATPEYVLLAPLVNGGQSGYAVAGGLDATGDGTPDLVVGGYRLNVNGVVSGAAWLVPGEYILTLPREPVVDGASPGQIHNYLPLSFGSGIWRVDGEDADEWFGAAVELVPDLSEPGRAGLAIGGPFGARSGVVRAGGVKLFRVDADPASPTYGIDPEPVAFIGGETDRTGGQLGLYTSSTWFGDRAALAIGAYESSALGLDEGASFFVDLAP